jgi:hypothetical protein
VTNPDPHIYFQSAFEAAMYGDVIIPTPFKLKQCSFISDINSLDLLLAALIFMKSDYVPGNDKTHDTLKEELEDLRSKALTPFLNEFMNKIRQDALQYPRKRQANKWCQFLRDKFTQVRLTLKRLGL